MRKQFKIDGILEIPEFDGTTRVEKIEPFESHAFGERDIMKGIAIEGGQYIVRARVFEDMDGKWVYLGTRVLDVTIEIKQDIGFMDW